MKTDLEIYRQGITDNEEENEKYYDIYNKIEKAIKYLESMNYEIIWKE